MKPRKIIQTNGTQYALCVVHADGSLGWLTGGGARGTDVQTYPTEAAARKALLQIKRRHTHYLWKDPVEVREFHGFGKQKHERQ